MKTKLYECFHRIAASSEFRTTIVCPPPGWESEFPDRVSSEIIQHVAFCAQCRHLLILRQGEAAVLTSDSEPDWTSLLARIYKKTRWEHLKSRIHELISNPYLRFPETAFAGTRSGTAPGEKMSYHLNIFEINMTLLPELSPEPLKVITLEYDSIQDRVELILGDFHPALKGCDVRIGFIQRNIIRSSLVRKPMEQELSMSTIESKLNRLFIKNDSSNTTFDRIIKRAHWVEGSITKSDRQNRAVFTLPSSLWEICHNKDYWALLLVG